jgi:hypothetical protein
VAKGTNSKSSRLQNNRVRRDVKKDSSWNDKEVQEEEEEVTNTARKPCPRNDATQSDDKEEEEDDKEEIKEGVARKNPLTSANSDDTDETYEDNKGSEEDEDNIGTEEDDDDPKLKKRKSRAKMKMPLDNGCMPKNKKGCCIISKKTFDPEKGLDKGIDKKRISAYLGLIDIKYSEPAQYKKIIEWFQKFRIHFGDRAHVRIIQDIVSNAQDIMFMGGHALMIFRMLGNKQQLL